MIKKKNSEFYETYIKRINNTFKNIELKNIKKLEKLIIKHKKKTIFIFGNGAGASIASHFSNDLSNTTKIKTFSFDNAAQLTCLANDYGYENWVKKIIQIYVDTNDLVILLSASGNSKNMINAAKYCLLKKINFFSITGFLKTNELNKISKNSVWIDSKSFNEVELTQLFVLLSVLDKIKFIN
jgi:D-sedoheptulose 7-phosphate isomerase